MSTALLHFSVLTLSLLTSIICVTFKCPYISEVVILPPKSDSRSLPRIPGDPAAHSGIRPHQLLVQA